MRAAIAKGTAPSSPPWSCAPLSPRRSSPTLRTSATTAALATTIASTRRRTSLPSTCRRRSRRSASVPIATMPGLADGGGDLRQLSRLEGPVSAVQRAGRARHGRRRRAPPRAGWALLAEAPQRPGAEPAQALRHGRGLPPSALLHQRDGLPPPRPALDGGDGRAAHRASGLRARPLPDAALWQ